MTRVYALMKFPEKKGARPGGRAPSILYAPRRAAAAQTSR